MLCFTGLLFLLTPINVSFFGVSIDAATKRLRLHTGLAHIVQIVQFSAPGLSRA